MFTGTLRFNIDPIGLYPDEELWRVWELSHLKSHLGMEYMEQFTLFRNKGVMHDEMT